MRAVWLVLLVAMPAQAGVAQAVEWLADQPPSVAGIEALHSAGADTVGVGHYGRVVVPPMGDDATLAVRALHAVGSGGFDPTRYPDPVRGTIDLTQQWNDTAARLDGAGAALLSFYALGGHAMGLARPDDVLARIAALQDGGFPCGLTGAHLDCTGFAVAALDVWDEPFDRHAAQAFVEGAYDGAGSYGDGNANTQAWAIIALQNLGQPVPDEAIAAFLALQRSDGQFGHTAERDGAGALATADAVLALSGFPGPRYAPMVVHQEHGPDGVRLAVEGWSDVRWHVDGRVETGPVLWLEETSGASVLVEARRDGQWSRAHVSWPGEEASMPFWPAVLLLAAAQRRKRA